MKSLVARGVVAFLALGMVVVSGARPAQQSTGVAVHGHWTVTISNPDGSLASRHEFENSLKAGAGTLIGRVFAPEPAETDLGSSRIYGWAVAMADTATSQTPCSASTSQVADGSALSPGAVCLTATTAAADQLTLAAYAAPSSDDLVVSPIDGGFRLSGTVTADTAGRITTVETWMVYEDNLDVSSGASETFAAAFTGTDAGPFEGIQDGQIIQVQVDITFS